MNHEEMSSCSLSSTRIRKGVVNRLVRRERSTRRQNLQAPGDVGEAAERAGKLLILQTYAGDDLAPNTR